MRYVVAVKREARAEMKQPLSDLLAGISGVQNIVGDDAAMRAQADLTPEAVEELKQAAPEQLYIEPLLAHKALLA
jgi:hypothetical protein